MKFFQIHEYIKLWTLDTLFPKHCAGCGKADELLCDQCQSQVVPVLQQQCGGCFRNSKYGRTCPRCRDKWALDNLLVAAYYEGPLKEVVHQFKYESRKEMADVLGKMILDNQSVREAIEKSDNLKFEIRNLKTRNNLFNFQLLNFKFRQRFNSLHQPTLSSKNGLTVVPIPLHRRRLWFRGYNQSALVARILSRSFYLPSSSKLIKRTRATKAQMSLPRQQRLLNLQNAFVASSIPHGTTIILVDDIATTGATLNAAAAVLKNAGAKKVIGLVVGRAR